jgi:hypothetical protein
MSCPITARSATAVSPAIVGVDNDVISSSCHGSTKQKVTNKKSGTEGSSLDKGYFFELVLEDTYVSLAGCDVG